MEKFNGIKGLGDVDLSVFGSVTEAGSDSKPDAQSAAVEAPAEVPSANAASAPPQAKAGVEPANESQVKSGSSKSSTEKKRKPKRARLEFKETLRFRLDVRYWEGETADDLSPEEVLERRVATYRHPDADLDPNFRIKFIIRPQVGFIPELGADRHCIVEAYEPEFNEKTGWWVGRGTCLPDPDHLDELGIGEYPVDEEGMKAALIRWLSVVKGRDGRPIARTLSGKVCIPDHRQGRIELSEESKPFFVIDRITHCRIVKIRTAADGPESTTAGAPGNSLTITNQAIELGASRPDHLLWGPTPRKLVLNPAAALRPSDGGSRVYFISDYIPDPNPPKHKSPRKRCVLTLAYKENDEVKTLDLATCTVPEIKKHGRIVLKKYHPDPYESVLNEAVLNEVGSEDLTKIKIKADLAEARRCIIYAQMNLIEWATQRDATNAEKARIFAKAAASINVDVDTFLRMDQDTRECTVESVLAQEKEERKQRERRKRDPNLIDVIHEWRPKQ